MTNLCQNLIKTYNYGTRLFSRCNSSRRTLQERVCILFHLDFGGHVWTFRAKTTLKSWPLKAKNTAQTTSEQLKTTLKNPSKRVFWPWKLSKWPSQRATFWPIIFIFDDIYRPVELKIELKLGLLRQNIMPNQLLNNSKQAFKKSLKWVT